MNNKGKRSEKGISTVMLALAATVILGFLGLVIEGWMLTDYIEHAQREVRKGCERAGQTIADGGTNVQATQAFYDSLSANKIPSAAYKPTLGSGTGFVRGILIGSAVWTRLDFYEPVTFLSFVKVANMHVVARAKCSTSGTRLSNIIIKQSDHIKSWNNGGTGIPIKVLGQGITKPDVDKGNSFRGAVYTFMWCQISSTNSAPDPNCAYQRVWPPLTVSPPSSSAVKNAMAQCWSGLVCNNVMAPIGTDLPVVTGTTNAQLVKSAEDSGYTVGTYFIAMIYSGVVNQAKATWDNVAVAGYALYQVTATDSNTITAVAKSDMTTNLNDLFYLGNHLLYPEEVPWTTPGG